MVQEPVALPPFYIPLRPTLSQGDIFRNSPALQIASRPLLVARHVRDHPTNPPRKTHDILREDMDAPRQGAFRWRLDRLRGDHGATGGEEVLIPAFRQMGILLTNDCEIDWDPDFRVMAMIRPLSALQPKDRADAVGLAIWPYFPLEQADEPEMEPSFVDFRRLTTIRADALRPADRHASVGDDVREAIAFRFWQFLFRRVLGDGEE